MCNGLLLFTRLPYNIFFVKSIRELERLQQIPLNVVLLDFSSKLQKFIHTFLNIEICSRARDRAKLERVRVQTHDVISLQESH